MLLLLISKAFEPLLQSMLPALTSKKFMGLWKVQEVRSLRSSISSVKFGVLIMKITYSTG